MTEERNDEQAIRDQTAEMAHTAGDMEERIEDLGEEIQDAKRTAAQRQDAPDEELVAGDWEGESSGSNQGGGPADVVDAGEGGDENR